MKLALGPLARTGSIKVTVALPYTLKEELDKLKKLLENATAKAPEK